MFKKYNKTEMDGTRINPENSHIGHLYNKKYILNNNLLQKQQYSKTLSMMLSSNKILDPKNNKIKYSQRLRLLQQYKQQKNLRMTPEQQPKYINQFVEYAEYNDRLAEENQAGDIKIENKKNFNSSDFGSPIRNNKSLSLKIDNFQYTPLKQNSLSKINNNISVWKDRQSIKKVAKNHLSTNRDHRKNNQLKLLKDTTIERNFNGKDKWLTNIKEYFIGNKSKLKKSNTSHKTPRKLSYDQNTKWSGPKTEQQTLKNDCLNTKLSDIKNETIRSSGKKSQIHKFQANRSFRAVTSYMKQRNLVKQISSIKREINDESELLKPWNYETDEFVNY